MTAAGRARINVNTGNVTGVIGALQHLLCAFASSGVSKVRLRVIGEQNNT